MVVRGGLWLEWVVGCIGGCEAVIGWVRWWALGWLVCFDVFCCGISIEMFWCFGLDVLVIARFWSQFEDCYVCFSCLMMWLFLIFKMLMWHYLNAK